MLNNTKAVKVVTALMITAALAWPQSAQANLTISYNKGYDRDKRHGYSRHDRGHHRYYENNHRHHYPRWGTVVHSLPITYVSLSFGGGRYYYCDGVYYRKSGFSYVVAEPPRGIVVRTLPNYFEPVIINGQTYYVSNGVYYKHGFGGYTVVADPTLTAVIAAGQFTINVPSKSGGYTSVMLRQSSNGYVGPQGEFYPEFPRVEQLRVMYGQ